MHRRRVKFSEMTADMLAEVRRVPTWSDAGCTVDQNTGMFNGKRVNMQICIFKLKYTLSKFHHHHRFCSQKVMNVRSDMGRLDARVWPTCVYAAFFAVQVYERAMGIE